MKPSQKIKNIFQPVQVSPGVWKQSKFQSALDKNRTFAKYKLSTIRPDQPIVKGSTDPNELKKIEDFSRKVDRHWANYVSSFMDKEGEISDKDHEHLLDFGNKINKRIAQHTGIGTYQPDSYSGGTFRASVNALSSAMYTPKTKSKKSKLHPTNWPLK